MNRIRASLLRLSEAATILATLWLCGFIWFYATLPEAPPSPVADQDAIVVLTGGSDRVPAGLALLAEGRGKKLFISGVYRGVEVRELLAISQKDSGRLSCCIVLGYEAGNTPENAREASEWLENENYRSFYLVTSNYHMRRAMLEFSLALPPHIRAIPHAVAPAAMTDEGWWKRGRLASIMTAEYTKYLLTLPKAMAVMAFRTATGWI